jgi:A/G-specific adenine glycosylase
MPKAVRPLLADKTGFQRALLGWYRSRARPLPWRQAPSLYRTVVSEFMLQQTQVKTALPYFERWMARLPDFAAAAAAPEAAVLKLWEGLGYYARARNLHRLCGELAAMPEIPRTPEGWLELPGVGPYTAAAVTSIAFGAPAACVDGNVVRILSRLTADRREFRDSGSAARILAPLAQELVPASDPGDHNQAMMELGATVCVRMGPRCPDCPVRSFCEGSALADPSELPRLAQKRTEKREVVRVWCETAGRLLLRAAPGSSRRLAHLHELPTPEEAGMRGRLGPLIARHQRSITRFRITESIHACPPPGRLGPGLLWVPLRRLDSVALSGPHRRWIRGILADREAVSPGSGPRSAPSRRRPPRP